MIASNDTQLIHNAKVIREEAFGLCEVLQHVLTGNESEGMMRSMTEIALDLIRVYRHRVVTGEFIPLQPDTHTFMENLKASMGVDDRVIELH